MSARRGGWLPDVPDGRDFTLTDCIDPLREAVLGSGRLAKFADLSEDFPPVEDQGATLATTAYSCGGLAEYFNRRCSGRLLPISKPFLYDVSRRMHGLWVDSGVSIRQVLRALIRFGAPPIVCVEGAAYPPHGPFYDPLLYGFVREYEAIRYYRVCRYEDRPPLQIVKTLLSMGVPCVFGMPLNSSVMLSNDSRIDCRPSIDEVVGGISGVFVGYDDEFRISKCGALRFRSTWGTKWGDSGYGWLSYEVLDHTIGDIWFVFDPSWSGSGDFAF